MERNSLKVLTGILVFIFALACGLFLARFLVPLYFLLFSAVSKTLTNFYIGVGIFVCLIILLDYILFKKRKYNWGIWISGTVILLLGFGVPLFMLDNNDMLWRQAVQYRRGPVYFIEFGDSQIRLLQTAKNLFELIWDKVYLFVYAYLAVFLAACIYLHKHGWQIKGVRIRL
jgi:hypothetical protein